MAIPFYRFEIDDASTNEVLSWFRDHQEVLSHTAKAIVRDARRYERYGGDHVIPSFEGIYFLLDAGEIVYVGKAQDVSSRLSDHWLKKKFDSYWCFGEVPYDWLEYIEEFYIRRFRPRLNRTPFIRPANLNEVVEQLEAIRVESTGAKK